MNPYANVNVPLRDAPFVAAFWGASTAPPGPAQFESFRHPKGTAMTADGRQPHILVVNDTQEILDLIQELLEDEGYRVTTSLARLDIAKIKTLGPDLIIQDLLFEQTQEEGWKFLTLAQLDPDLARIPFILCTAATRTVNDPQMAQQLDHLGIRVVLKPFNIEDLLTAIAETLTAQTLIDEVADETR
jgi:CheY-like chemotaxis protein